MHSRKVPKGPAFPNIFSHEERLMKGVEMWFGKGSPEQVIILTSDHLLAWSGDQFPKDHFPQAHDPGVGCLHDLCGVFKGWHQFSRNVAVCVSWVVRPVRRVLAFVQGLNTCLVMIVWNLFWIRDLLISSLKGVSCTPAMAFLQIESPFFSHWTLFENHAVNMHFFDSTLTLHCF